MLKYILFFCVLFGNVAYGCQPNEWFIGDPTTPKTTSGGNGAVKDFPGSGHLDASSEVSKDNQISKGDKTETIKQATAADKSASEKKDKNK